MDTGFKNWWREFLLKNDRDVYSTSELLHDHVHKMPAEERSEFVVNLARVVCRRMGLHGAHLEEDEKARAALRVAGQYDDSEVLADLEAYLSIGVDAALKCPSPLVRALAAIDRRVGKRTLRKLAVGAEHQLVRELYLLRCAVEGIEVAV